MVCANIPSGESGFHVNEAIHDRPEDQVVFEFLGDPGHFQSDPLFFCGYEVKARVSGSDVVDDFGFHVLFLSVDGLLYAV